MFHTVAAAYNDRYNNRDDKATKPDNRDKFARLIFRTSRSLLFRSTVFIYSVHAHNSQYNYGTCNYQDHVSLGGQGETSDEGDGCGGFGGCSGDGSGGSSGGSCWQ